MAQSVKKITEHRVSSGSWKSGAGWNNVLHIKHNRQIHCPSVSIVGAGCLYVQSFSTPYILSLVSGSLLLCHHLSNRSIRSLIQCMQRSCYMEEKKIYVHPSHPRLGTLLNVLRGQVAAGTTYCRNMVRRIEVLEVWLQCETLDGCTENFRVPNSLSESSMAARHGVLLSLTGL